MKKNEQDILNIIEEKTKNIPVPDSISPKQVEDMLKQKDAGKRKYKKNGHPVIHALGGRASHDKVYKIGGLAAACVVLAAGIVLYGTVENRRSLPKEECTKSAVSETMRNADSYDEIYSYIEESQRDKEVNWFGMGDGEFNSSSRDMAVEDSAATGKTAVAESSDIGGGNEYSTTNVRQEGVDEADIVKTDGRYLYVLREDRQTLSIVDTNGNMKEIQTIVEEDYAINEFYLIPEEKKLIVICSYYVDASSDTDKKKDSFRGDFIQSEYSIVVTYDVSNASQPKKLGSVSQSGSYTSSRMADGYVYLFSEYFTGVDIRRNRPETFIPMVDDGLMKQADIYMPLSKEGTMYAIITAIDIKSPDKPTDSKAIFSTGGYMYVSNQNIYYYETTWEDETDKCSTTVRKISYNKGQLKAKAQGEFNGYIEDSFSMDEYKGNLRVVTTAGDTNSVYVLDEKLEIIGKIENLAKDERVYSARFMGNIGYFVTFRETDPLFTVDLSDPRKLKITGELKIPGFSEYLHPYGDGKLLGIGMDADEETLTTDGVKLTMFDISDPEDVKEENTYVLKNTYSTDIFYDYKGVLADTGKNIIGFAADCENGQKYYVFSYDEKNGFICNMEEEINGGGYGFTRGVYINDTLYVVQGNVIEAYNMKDYKKIDDIVL